VGSDLASEPSMLGGNLPWWHLEAMARQQTLALDI
jgi:hypothetical protein